MNCRNIGFSRRLCSPPGDRYRGAQAQDQFSELSLRRRHEFIVGFFQYDSRAHLQLDGQAMTLTKRWRCRARAIRPAASP